ncbi:MAG TPA: SAM-dependent methyltransferase, partial [Jatrophihabitantaceae bacterium]|nr:SAM-dependent methyltransferase [Jatrophihabitantaceae bacterium]
MDAKEWNDRYAETSLLWSAAPNRWVAAELADVPVGRAVDLGAGEGRNALWLAARGFTVTAVDFAKVA